MMRVLILALLLSTAATAQTFRTSPSSGLTEAAADLLYQQLDANNTVAAKDIYSTATNGSCYEDADQCITSDGAGGYEFMDEAGNVVFSFTTAGVITATGSIVGAAGTIANPTYAGPGNSTNSGIYYPSDDTPAISLNGAEIMRWTSNTFANVAATGNMSIRHASAAAGNPTYSWQGDTDTGVFRVAANEVGITSASTQRFSIDDVDTSVVQGGVAMATNAARVGGVIETNITAVGNVGGGTDDLMTFALAANSLAVDMQSVTMTAWGTFAANGNNKTLTAAFGATTIISTGAIAANTGDWRIVCTIMRTAAATQDSSCQIITSNALLVASSDFTSPGETLSGAVTIKLTGAGTADNDIVQEGWMIRWDNAN